MKHLYLTLVSLSAVLAFASCEKAKIENNPFPTDKLYVIESFEDQPFLGETYINDFDYAYANNFLVELYKKETSGACSSFRYGDFAARNLDWFIRDYALLIVHMASNQAKNRYASVAIASSNTLVNRALIKGGIINDKYEVKQYKMDRFRDVLPIFTTDGINEKGVCVNTNIVIHENGVREGYIPCTGDSTRTKTSFVSLPRFILDNCASCDEAIAKCAELNLTQAYSGPLRDEDSHIFVSDNDKTVILEWYNNKMVYTEFPRSSGFKSSKGMPAIMTNFYNCIGNKYVDSNGKIDIEKFLLEHPYAMGVERYETLRDGIEGVNSVETAQKQIEKVFYSNYYDLNKKWYTENGMSCVLRDKVWYYPLADGSYKAADGIYDAIKKTFEPGGYQENRCNVFKSFDYRMQLLDKGIPSNDEWYSELTDVFDIKNKTLYVMPQQGWYNHQLYKFTVRGKY